ncbi:unnamed protein product, partial [marine sediment metagenome]
EPQSIVESDFKLIAIVTIGPDLLGPMFQKMASYFFFLPLHPPLGLQVFSDLDCMLFQLLRGRNFDKLRGI